MTKDIAETLAELLGRNFEAPAPRVVVKWEETTRKVLQINRALSRCSEDEQIALLADLWRLWRDEEKAPEAREIFGAVYDQYRHHRTMLTITSTGRQCRAWHSIPNPIAPDHVDSAGRGLLFGVYGEPEDVVRYTDALLPEEVRRYNAITAPNGTVLYMPIEYHRVLDGK